MKTQQRSLLGVGLLCALGVLGCGDGDHGPRSHTLPVEDASAFSDGEVKGSGEVIVNGDSVDIDGDGVGDGVAIDSNQDGVSDGVDTNGDGVIDQPLPGGSSTPGLDGSLLIGADAGAPYPIDPSGAVLCGSAPCLCSDGVDNDMDGLSDLLDPECVSTWDNDESSLATGIPGDNRDDACQDCFFDGNSGAGDDGCKLPTSCILEGNASSGHGSCNTCQQTAECKNFCQAYTPNGCDCFGCCDVKVGSTIKHLLLSNSCNVDGTKLTGCTECVPSTTCVNTCGKCELCAGKTLNDLPPECFVSPVADAGTPTSGDAGSSTPSDGGSSDSGTITPPPPPPPSYTCDNGEQVCGADLPACPQGALCQFGCCILSPFLF